MIRALLARPMTEIVTSPQQAVRRRFTWILPAFFAGATALGAVWPGHSGQLFCVGALVGIWACLLLDASGEPSTWLLPTLFGGVPVLLLLGLLLDRLESDLRVWLLALFATALLAGFVLLQGYRDLEQALDYQGSFLAFGVCALQIGAYGATLLLLVLGASRSARH